MQPSLGDQPGAAPPSARNEATESDKAGFRHSTLLTPDSLRRDFDALAADLKNFIAGHEAIFIPNPGNFGDGVILAGALRFLEDYEIPVRIMHASSRKEKLHLGATVLGNVLARNKAFIYCGSGAWSKVCDLGYRNVSRLSRVTNKIFVLPTTYEWHGVKPEVKLYRRDKDESLANVPDSKFCHDTAFYLALIHPDRVLADRKPPAKKLGLILRTDNEARPDRIIPTDFENFDISAAGWYKDPVERFFRYIDQFEHVITDRLHVAIGGALLSKRVSILPNNYWKIRAIYRASMQGVFSNVELIDDARLTELLAESRG